MNSRSLLTAAALVASISSALAGDLGGGNCCTDLDERVSELEATVARRGNRKVSVTVTGQVNKAILFTDDGSRHDMNVGDNSIDPSRIAILGEAKFSADAKAGYLLEIAVPGTTELSIRHSAIYIDSASFGRVWIGHTSQATDGIAEITTANTLMASRLLNFAPFVNSTFGGFNLPFDGDRMDLVRYDTPSIGGFIGSASMANGLSDGNNWDLALRFGREIEGIRIAAGIGYRESVSMPFNMLIGYNDKIKTLVGSASIMHVTSGLFMSGAYGESKLDDVKLSGVHFQGGVERNWFGPGKTTLFGEWGRMDLSTVNQNPSWYGIGAVQSIDAAALDLYATVRRYDLDDRGVKDVTTGMVGARLRF